MRLPARKQIAENPSLDGRFFSKFTVAKGYRYRYKFIWRDEDYVDKSGNNKYGLGKVKNESVETNYIEVPGQSGSEISVFDSGYQPIGGEEEEPMQQPVLGSMKSFTGSEDVPKDL